MKEFKGLDDVTKQLAGIKDITKGINLNLVKPPKIEPISASIYMPKFDFPELPDDYEGPAVIMEKILDNQKEAIDKQNEVIENQHQTIIELQNLSIKKDEEIKELKTINDKKDAEFIEYQNGVKTDKWKWWLTTGIAIVGLILSVVGFFV